MAKPEWGVKRVCQSCAAKFYDLNRSPITCPKCAAKFDPDALLKSRRSRPAPAAKVAKPEVAASAKPAADRPPEDDAKLGEDGEDGETGQADSRSDDADDDDSVLQDTSELGDDGVSEVVVTSDDENT